MIIPRRSHVPKMGPRAGESGRSDGQVLLYELIGELGNSAGDDGTGSRLTPYPDTAPYRRRQ
jgi:hypothetical protein